jgi:transcriptional regulator with XRE-family HTH domain
MRDRHRTDQTWYISAMPRSRIEDYNALGMYVMKEKRSLSLAEVARRGNIDAVTMGRWLRNDIARLPPPEVLQGIADGLGRPLMAVQRAAVRAAGAVPPLTTLNEAQQTVAEAMAGVDEFWQRAIVDLVLRTVEEVSRGQERLGQ